MIKIVSRCCQGWGITQQQARGAVGHAVLAMEAGKQQQRVNKARNRREKTSVQTSNRNFV